MNTRRDFIRITGMTGAALAIGFHWQESAIAADNVPATFKPNAWISIEPDGRVLLTVGKTEMGQGVSTSLPMILADELGADLTKVELVQASPGKDFTDLGTGGSWSVGGSWRTLRTAGAAAPEQCTLLKAALDFGARRIALVSPRPVPPAGGPRRRHRWRRGRPGPGTRTLPQDAPWRIGRRW